MNPYLGKLTTVRDGRTLEYGGGKFDDWCVYVSGPEVPRYAPRDTQYFEELEALGTRLGGQRIYSDFVLVYDKTGARIESSVWVLIAKISDGYGKDAGQIETILATLYAAMVAEENKAHAKLKKRVKRLGVHQVLIERIPATVAAHWSRGKKWRELDSECKKRGF